MVIYITSFFITLILKRFNKAIGDKVCSHAYSLCNLSCNCSVCFFTYGRWPSSLAWQLSGEHCKYWYTAAVMHVYLCNLLSHWWLHSVLCSQDMVLVKGSYRRPNIKVQPEQRFSVRCHPPAGRRRSNANRHCNVHDCLHCGQLHCKCVHWLTVNYAANEELIILLREVVPLSMGGCTVLIDCPMVSSWKSFSSSLQDLMKVKGVIH